MIKTLVKEQLIKEIRVVDALIKMMEKSKIEKTETKKQESTIWI